MGDLGDGKHDGGPEDPRIGLIKVQALTIQYAISRTNMVKAAIDMVQGALTGETPAINKIRQLSKEEVQQCEWEHPYSFRNRTDRSQGARLHRAGYRQMDEKYESRQECCFNKNKL